MVDGRMPAPTVASWSSARSTRVATAAIRSTSATSVVAPTASARPARSPSTVATSTTARTSISTPAVARRSAMPQAAAATWPRPPAMMTAVAAAVAPIRSRYGLGRPRQWRRLRWRRGVSRQRWNRGGQRRRRHRRHRRDQLGWQPGEYDRGRRHLRCPGLRAGRLPAEARQTGEAGKTITVPTGKPGRGGGGGKVRVTKVPSTGVGYIPTSPVAADHDSVRRAAGVARG